MSSTEVELADALRVRDAVMAWLSADGGWPAGLRAMSGNGGHADYRVDLPNDAATRDLFKACLAVLHQRFATDTVEIDRNVYNAARICKIYGTVARKGDHTPERPHRRAAIEERPILTPVTREQLEWLAAQRPDARRTAARGRTGTTTARPTDSAGRRHPPHMTCARRLRPGSGISASHQGWHAVQCPWIDAHSGASGRSETAIREPDAPGQAWGFKCQHASCGARTTRDVWAFFRADAVTERLTDAGAAERFARVHGDAVRFNHRRQRWLLWEGHRWRPDADAAVARLALTFVRVWQREALDIPNLDERQATTKFALRLERRTPSPTCWPWRGC